MDLDPARWRTLEPTNRSAARVERILARFLGALCIVFTAQTVPYTVAEHAAARPGWSWVLVVLTFGTLAGLTVAGLLGRVGATRRWAQAGSLVYLVLLLAWPILVGDPAGMLGRMPWPWYLCSVLLAAASFGFRLRWAIVFIVATPAVFVAVRSTPPGGGVTVPHALVDAGYAFVLGAAVLLLMTMLRRVAAAVDLAHATATAKYTAAVRAHEHEVERVQVDSILHDSVLTTFITASRADTAADRQFAVAMATHALSEVVATHALPGVETLVTIDALRGRFEDACRELGIDVEVTTTGPSEHRLPVAVVETFIGAALQALTNSVQHAGPGPVARQVFAEFRAGGVVVTIRDDGVGFDTETMTPGRLGVRVSIVERIRNIGGVAEISSRPGEGTTVRLVWPDPDRPALRAEPVRLPLD
ncbi:sensor histidine kinase [Frondihabitans cladoniiphilus]|uniref:Histidine kinase/HSP90-like ATPase domain-containing protein n=1 Tax=Frondihabitans cladoniiphilus TaxID=715785 RepID=A0ABP8VIJ2_9MICO